MNWKESVALSEKGKDDWNAWAKLAGFGPG
jgi:hypothetical protein